MKEFMNFNEFVNESIVTNEERRFLKFLEEYKDSSIKENPSEFIKAASKAKFTKECITYKLWNECTDTEEAAIELYDSTMNESATYSYGCAMLYFDFPEIESIHNDINEEDIYNDDSEKFGLEDESHVTLLYGLHKEVTTEKMLESIVHIEPSKINFINISAFENDKFDVLKFTAEGKCLNEMNNSLSNLPHTTDYPDYNAHSTIAYLKSGMAKKYIEKFDGKQFTVNPTKLVYSKPDGTKDIFDIVDGKIKQ